MGYPGPLPQLTDRRVEPVGVAGAARSSVVSGFRGVLRQIASHLLRHERRGRIVGAAAEPDRSDVQLLPERQGASRIILIDTGHGQPHRLGGGLDEAAQTPAVDARRRDREPFRSAGPVEPNQGVEMDDAAALVLGHLRVLHRRHVRYAIAGHAESLRNQPPQRDGEPTPQVRRPPLPHNLGGVVVAVEAQRLAQLGIVVAVAHQAMQRVAVAAMAGAANTGRPHA